MESTQRITNTIENHCEYDTFKTREKGDEACVYGVVVSMLDDKTHKASAEEATHRVNPQLFCVMGYVSSSRESTACEDIIHSNGAAYDSHGKALCEYKLG
eukprot:732876_1